MLWTKAFFGELWAPFFRYWEKLYKNKISDKPQLLQALKAVQDWTQLGSNLNDTYLKSFYKKCGGPISGSMNFEEIKIFWSGEQYYASNETIKKHIEKLLTPQWE